MQKILDFSYKIYLAIEFLILQLKIIIAIYQIST